MKINLIVVANEFSESVVKTSSSDGLDLFYRAYATGRFGKILSLILLVFSSWFSKLMPKSVCSLYIPHSYKKFGLIINVCSYDHLIVIDDGVSFLSEQSFQKKYIFSLFKSDLFKNILACDDNLISDKKDLNVEVEVLKRSTVVKKMIDSHEIESRYCLDTPHIVIIDNGNWSEEECYNIFKKVDDRFKIDYFLALHPARNSSFGLGIKLDLPLEKWWALNQKSVLGLVCNFSTAAININSIAPDLDLFFVPPHTTDHLDLIKKIKGKWL